MDKSIQKLIRFYGLYSSAGIILGYAIANAAIA